VTMPRYIDNVPSLATPMLSVLEMGRYIAVKIIMSACSATNTRAITAVIWALCHFVMRILTPICQSQGSSLGTGSPTLLRFHMRHISSKKKGPLHIHVQFRGWAVAAKSNTDTQVY